MIKKSFVIAITSITALCSCNPKTTEMILSTTNDIINSGTNISPALTNADVIKGLKEALSVGTNNSTNIVSKIDGFYKNPQIFIPWPEEAKTMKEKLLQLGFTKQVNDFETSLNRAAEEASKEAAPIFLNAITNMSIGDGFAILNGNDTAATHYLREKTYAALYEKFSPTVTKAIENVKVTSYWNPLVTKYNLIPGVKKQNPDLNAYVTNKAINGLMLMISQEEMKIRKDPAARVSEILIKVFGYKK